MILLTIARILPLARQFIRWSRDFSPNHITQCYKESSQPPRVNHFETGDSKEGADITLTTYPGLNCLEQEDPGLIQALRSDILYPPSKTGQANNMTSDKNRIKHVTLNTVLFLYLYAYVLWLYEQAL